MAPDEFEDTTNQVGDEVARKATRGRGRAVLVVLAGAEVGKTHKILTKLTTIGRSNLANVRMDEEGVSRRHAQLAQEGDAVILRDLDSKNGTFVNGTRVTEHTLKEGDKIVLGSAIIKFTFSDTLDEKFQDEMYEAALIDALTKVHNKKYFLDRIEREVAYALRHRTPLSLLMLDLDHFKDINDSCGHLAGDRALTSVASLIGSTLRQEDVVARYGGDEFVVLCRGVTLVGAQTLARRICRLVSGYSFADEGKPFRLTISAGVATLPMEAVGETISGAGADELIAMADDALYEAKHRGRDQVAVPGRKLQSR